jgi:hypothetical protein
LDATPDLLARVFELGDPLLEQVAGHLVCLAAPDNFAAPSDHRRDLVAALESWRWFIWDLLSQRLPWGLPAGVFSRSGRAIGTIQMDAID